VSDLLAFNNRVHHLLAAQDCGAHWEAEEAREYMANCEARRRQFEELASRLVSRDVQPRLETIVGYFPQAGLSRDEPVGHCAAWFGYCERFPATARIGFAVEHDLKWRRAYLRYEVSMMPLFVNLNEEDRLEMSLEEPDEAQAAPWVEERLLEFLEAYLQIDRGPADADDESATDPVCGMRIQRGEAAGSFVYRGHPYFFCSEACQKKFVESPNSYVQFKTL
jgi:YHS domain-containing protein